MVVGISSEISPYSQSDAGKHLSATTIQFWNVFIIIFRAYRNEMYQSESRYAAPSLGASSWLEKCKYLRQSYVDSRLPRVSCTCCHSPTDR